MKRGAQQHILIPFMSAGIELEFNWFVEQDLNDLALWFKRSLLEHENDRAIL